MTSVSAVHPGRHPPAPPAPRTPRPRVRGDHHRAVDVVDPVDHYRRQMRKQNPATALTSHSPESTTTLSRPALRPLDAAASASRKVSQNPVNGSLCSNFLAHIGPSWTVTSRGASTPEGRHRPRVAPDSATKVGQIIRTFTAPRVCCPGREPRFQRGDLAATGLQDGSVDGVWSGDAFFFASDLIEALGEVRRVLCPGGRLVMTVCVSLDDQPSAHPLDWRPLLPACGIAPAAPRGNPGRPGARDGDVRGVDRARGGATGRASRKGR